MRQSRSKEVLLLGLLLLTVGSSGAVRISFLSEKSALLDTAAFLKSNGCSQENCEAFEEAVKRYFSTPFGLDLSKFPALTNGFYSFASMSEVVAALPYPLDETRHPWGLNCFDTVILLAGGPLRLKQSPDERWGTFLAPCRRDLTNNIYDVWPEATPRQAYLRSCPEWARRATEETFPLAAREARVGLTAALYRFYRLPESVTQNTVCRDIHKSLRSAWNEEGLMFPERFEVVLCHEAKLPQPLCLTSHAGLLYRRKLNGYTFIEKSGGFGPFVRLDFDNRDDLLLWLVGEFGGTGEPGSPRRFATFNATEIRALERIR